MQYALSFLLGIILLVSTTHADWRSQYKGAEGLSCCDQSDCIKAEVSLIEEPGHGDTIEILVSFIEPPTGKGASRFVGKALQVPAQSVHMSEDPRGYWCHMPAISLGRTWEYGGLLGPQGETRACGPPHYEISERCLRCAFVALGG